MDAPMCRLCKEPIWNFLCVDCIGSNITQWLPEPQINDFKGFHHMFSSTFSLYGDVKNHCLHCKNYLTVPVCPYCYTNEVYQWLSQKDASLAQAFVMVFNFDFEGSGYKEFTGLQGIQPLEGEKREGSDEGFCEECECYSPDLHEKENKWTCESCRED